ncbi:MAG: ABC transporter permease subunit [Butyrivibrio sp.]|uniref:ABC transporter permease n=1 Tax=Butyrivibrio sp. TaxID=28121 RepID=UPI0025E801D3|nr:ABC transporter permease subunit [Butyrivibrio sp.]MCR5773281.1 ABC transporter permease subunit [Butyrivibrio sp.]
MSSKPKTTELSGKNDGFWHNVFKHHAYLVLALPAVLILFFFNYVPMAGLVLAFKSFDYTKGIWFSPWNGIENFKFLLQSKNDFIRITRNTLMYYVIFTALGQFLNVVLAIAIDQFAFKRVGKTMQTIMIIPVFVSYAAVQFIVMAYLSSGTGIINNLLGGKIPFYRTAKYWPYILTIVKMWNGVGYGSVLYMSVLAGIDTSLYEAASIDGASKWQQIKHVTLPSLIPMITVMLLLSVGGIMHSDTGLFYQVTRNTGILYETTQVIDSYVLNAIMKNSNFGFTAATTFFQSIVGLLLMLLANGIVKKIAPDNSLF